jgi:hypothetical protein
MHKVEATTKIQKMKDTIATIIIVLSFCLDSIVHVNAATEASKQQTQAAAKNRDRVQSLNVMLQYLRVLCQLVSTTSSLIYLLKWSNLHLTPAVILGTQRRYPKCFASRVTMQ